MKARLLKLALMPMAWLPLPALYLLSDLIYLIVYRIAGYRKRVVRENLRICFPEKSSDELRGIERDFYRNFADNIVETIKLLHISDKEMRRRMTFDGVEIIDSLLADGRSIVVYFSHTFCWEWAPSITLNTEHKPSADCIFAQVYRPLRSPAVDSLMLDIRSRFGSHSIPKSSTLRDLLRWKRDRAVSITGFMSDQHPSHGDPGWPTMLLGRPTLMITGTETLARKLDMAVVYWDMSRRGRGRYHLSTKLMAQSAGATLPGALTEQYTRLLETTIRRDPALWLWSHNRWKRPVTLPVQND